MRQILIYTVIFCLGGVAFWWLSPLLNDKDKAPEIDPSERARLEAQRQVDEARAKEAANNPKPAEISPPETTIESTPYTDQNGEQNSVLVEGPFAIVGTHEHPASGQVEIIRSPEETIIQYKNYQGTPGSNLKIYLAKDLTAKDFISLGESRGSKGDFIYGAPLDIDFEDYQYIMTWSESQDEVFDYVKVN